MKTKAIKFIVTFTVQCEDDFDTNSLKDAIEDGLYRANNEGYLTTLEDETTVVETWVVRHESTV